MAVLLSTHPEPQSVQAFGNWFAFKPGQMKVMQDGIANWIAQYKRDQGFMVLPESLFGFTEDGLPGSEDNKKLVQEKEKAIKEANVVGRRNILDALKKRIHNLEVSLKRDLEMANIKTDALTYATDADAQAYELLHKLKELDKAVETPADRIKKLREAQDVDANGSNT